MGTPKEIVVVLMASECTLSYGPGDLINGSNSPTVIHEFPLPLEPSSHVACIKHGQMSFFQADFCYIFICLKLIKCCCRSRDGYFQLFSYFFVAVFQIYEAQPLSALHYC